MGRNSICRDPSKIEIGGSLYLCIQSKNRFDELSFGWKLFHLKPSGGKQHPPIYHRAQKLAVFKKSQRSRRQCRNLYTDRNSQGKWIEFAKIYPVYSWRYPRICIPTVSGILGGLPPMESSHSKNVSITANCKNSRKLTVFLYTVLFDAYTTPSVWAVFFLPGTGYESLMLSFRYVLYHFPKCCLLW